MNIGGEEVQGYLHQVGAPWRYDRIDSQISPRFKFPELVLPKGSLYDLEPGKLFAFEVDSFTCFERNFDSQREL